MIVVARGRLDDLRYFGVDGAAGHLIQGLLDDSARLPHLFEAHEVSVVGVAVLADWHVEVNVGVGRVRPRLAYVPRDARATERRAGEPDCYRVGGGDDADSDRAPEPDSVLGEHRLVLFEAVREVVHEALHVLGEALVSVVRHAADAPRVRRQSRAELLLENLQNLLALAQRPEQHRERAYVQRVSGEPEQVRGDSVKLGQNRAYVVRARRDFQAHHLLDGLDPDEPVRDRGDVVEPVPVGRYHRVEAVLGYLLHPAVQESYVAVEVYDGLAVEAQDDPQHAVGRRVLRPHVQDHLGVVE